MLRNFRHLVDLLFLLVLTPPQILMAMMIVKSARQRFSPAVVRALKIAMWTVAVITLAVVIPTTSSSVAFLVYQISAKLGIWPVVRVITGFLKTGFCMWVLASTPSFLCYLAYRWVRHRPSIESNPQRRRLLQLAGTAAVAAPFAAEAFAVFIQRWQFQVREVEVPVKDLHPDLAGLRIVQLSDVHLGDFLSEREFAPVIDASNELKAHVALMTGDLISEFGDPIDKCIRQLARLKSDAGTFGSLGNHEHYTNTEDYVKRTCSRLGMDFLRYENRALRFGSATLNLAGIDYQPFARRGQYLTGVEALKMQGAVNVLLSHNPDVFDESAQQGWDLTLAGHTHGGQVTVEILEQTLNVARFYTRYVSGLYRQGSSMCYVTRGIGTIGIPARLGATPEITLLKLRKA